MAVLKHAAALCCMAMVWLGLPAHASADTPGFHVRDVVTRSVEQVYRLDALLDLELSPAASEALHSGLPLVISMDIEVLRPRQWLWSETVASLSQRYTLLYHALSNRYVVKNLNTGMRFSYPTLHSALRALGQIHSFPMLDQGILNPDQGPYQGRLRVRLDLDELPTPVRLRAWMSAQWQLVSEWYTWPLQP